MNSLFFIGRWCKLRCEWTWWRSSASIRRHQWKQVQRHICRWLHLHFLSSHCMPNDLMLLLFSVQNNLPNKYECLIQSRYSRAASRPTYLFPIACRTTDIFGWKMYWLAALQCLISSCNYCYLLLCVYVLSDMAQDVLVRWLLRQTMASVALVLRMMLALVVSRTVSSQSIEA